MKDDPKITWLTAQLIKPLRRNLTYGVNSKPIRVATFVGLKNNHKTVEVENC
jgi:hypothetical protein